MSFIFRRAYILFIMVFLKINFIALKSRQLNFNINAVTQQFEMEHRIEPTLQVFSKYSIEHLQYCNILAMRYNF